MPSSTRLANTDLLFPISNDTFLDVRVFPRTEVLDRHLIPEPGISVHRVLSSYPLRNQYRAPYWLGKSFVTLFADGRGDFSSPGQIHSVKLEDAVDFYLYISYKDEFGDLVFPFQADPLFGFVMWLAQQRIQIETKVKYFFRNDSMDDFSLDTFEHAITDQNVQRVLNN